MKDDKTYPYIQITKEPYPQVILTRKIKKDGSKYFGPYTDSRRLRTILKVIHKVFPIEVVVISSMVNNRAKKDIHMFRLSY